MLHFAHTPLDTLHSRIFTMILTLDGNFDAKHHRMRNPAADVWLEDGTGFMVNSAAYAEHMRLATDAHSKQGPPCFEHENAGQGQGTGNLDCTGIGMCACARHGCFVPHTGVPFEAGEK